MGGNTVSTGKERQKQLAREHYERQRQRRVERESRAKRTAVIGSTVGVVVVVGGIVAGITLIGGGGDEAISKAAAAGSCTYTKDAQGKSKDVGLPPAKPNLQPRTMTINTNDGDIVGVVAMANAGPGTNGSQFFIVFGDETASLPPQYTPFGTVTKGMEIVDKVAKGGMLADGTAPKVPVEIKHVTISAKS